MKGSRGGSEVEKLPTETIKSLSSFGDEDLNSF